MKRIILAAGAALLAAASIPALVHGTSDLQETVKPVFERALPNVPGKSLIAVEVVYAPGGASPSHTHPKSAFIYAYVLEGEIVSAVDNEEPRVYRAGESWHEVPGAQHRVSRNASATKPAKLLAIFVLDPGERQLVFPAAK
jgi:quercetin dioxygenase-like cupin family protein